MKKTAIIQARMGSTRFPGKVLENLNGKPVLQWVVEAANKIPAIDNVVVATSDKDCDQQIVAWCAQNNQNVFQGDEQNLLKRFYDAAAAYNADAIVRLTADCPLLDPNIVGQVLYLVSNGDADYASNVMPASWPDGLDCEAFTVGALSVAYKNAKCLSDKEHVTPYIINNQHMFKCLNVSSPIKGLQEHRWTVDTKEDMAFIKQLVSKTKTDATIYDYLETLKKTPNLKQPSYKRNEGFDKSLLEEEITNLNFSKSNELLERSLKVIPLGAQTFSKSHILYPAKKAPLFLTHGSGARVWDVDSNEYIDLVSALLPVVLGYNDTDVNYAIQAQLSKGISFSLSTELEVELAEKMCSIIPSAEKVRFAKNGTDVTSAAVRLARAYTGRDKMIMCGYHGWQDWSIGTTTRNKGVPKAVSDLSVSVPYNDLDKVEALLKTEQFAGMIMESCNVTEPNPGYLQSVKDLCEKYGSVLIFDEIVTGFRYSLGGAQSYFGVTPHLSCFGKAMGNGMPISAIVGQNYIMKEMDEIFFSGTFGGETLSIAAALATINKIEKNGVIDHLWAYGKDLSDAINKIITRHKLRNVIELGGVPCWKLLQFTDHENGSADMMKTLFMQEMIKRGILISGALNISGAFGAVEKIKILEAFDGVLQRIAEGLQNNTLKALLECKTIQPLFKVR